MSDRIDRPFYRGQVKPSEDGESGIIEVDQEFIGTTVAVAVLPPEPTTASTPREYIRQVVRQMDEAGLSEATHQTGGQRTHQYESDVDPRVKVHGKVIHSEGGEYFFQLEQGRGYRHLETVEVIEPGIYYHPEFYETFGKREWFSTASRYRVTLHDKQMEEFVLYDRIAETDESVICVPRVSDFTSYDEFANESLAFPVAVALSDYTQDEYRQYFENLGLADGQWPDTADSDQIGAPADRSLEEIEDEWVWTEI